MATNAQTGTPSKNFTPRTHHTRLILMLATCDVYRAHRHGSESPHPGSTPGLNPCNHLTWLVGGPWRTHKHNTYSHIAWLASGRRNQLACGPRRGACKKRGSGCLGVRGRVVVELTGALTKQKGGEAKGRNVTPPSMDSGSKASTYGKAKGHANHWAKPRRCPRRLVKKGRGDRVIREKGKQGIQPLPRLRDARVGGKQSRGNRDRRETRVSRGSRQYPGAGLRREGRSRG